MKRFLLSLIAILLIAMGCFSFAQENDWIEYGEDEQGWTITVYSPDKSYGIVIQDKNLWATMTWAWTWANIESYWNYYQWWNNYGFPSNSSATITTTTSKVDASAYWPENPYSSDVFIKVLSDWSSVRNDNLRWWGWDDETNWYGLTSDSPITGRQWPCPEWYHIPSLWDRNELVVLWYNNKYDADLVTGDYNYIIKEDVPISIDLSEDLLIPFAWFREADTTDVLAVGSWVYSWTSSPDDIYWINLNLQRGSRGNPRRPYYMITYDVDYRAYGLTLRCFKDERVYRTTSKTLTLNVMSGENLVSTWVSFTNDEPLTSGQILEAIDWLSNEIELATGYHFEWYTDDEWVETGFDLDTAISEGTITANLTLTWKIEPNKYTISFLDENGAEIMSGEYTYDQETTLPANTSTKEWYTFKWWKDGQWNTYEDWTTVKNLITENGAILEFSPIREENSKPSGGGSSWWGGRWRGSKATDSQTDIHWTADDEKTDSDSEKNNNEDLDGLEVVNYNPDLPAEQQMLSDGLTPEMHRAYKFAYKHGITTMPTILDADMFGPLDRISMAKMLSQYAINILWKTPNISIGVPNFPDVSPELNEQFWNSVTLAYQLWIMWINIDEFRPFDLVPRSEFGTALSRMLYQTSDWIYEKTDEYYTPHFKKLKEEEIMTLLDPNIEELRWYVMIMLMRSSEKN